MALVGPFSTGFDGHMATPRTDEHDDQRSDPLPEEHATVEESLTVHGDLRLQEIETLIGHWAKLDARLRSFRPGTVRLDLYLKDRDTPSQHLTLEAAVERWPVLIATSSDTDLMHALNVVRDEMIRLITDAKDLHSARRRR